MLHPPREPTLTKHKVGIVPLLVPSIVSGWILMASLFVRELTLSVVLSRPGTEALECRSCASPKTALWGRLSALGIVMIAISTTLVIAATLIGNRFKITG